MSELDALRWPRARLGEALEALSHVSGLRSPGSRSEAPEGPSDEHEETLARWVAAAGEGLNLEARLERLTHDALGPELGRRAPLLLGPFAGEGHGLFAVASGSRRHAVLLGPDQELHRVAWSALGSAVAAPIEEPARRESQAVLSAAHVPEARRERALRLLVARRLAGKPVALAASLRLSASAPLSRQAAREGLGFGVAGWLGAQFGLAALRVLSFWLVGRWAFSGRFDAGWMTAWVLVVLSQIPLQAVASWLQGGLGIALGALLKRRLLLGALQSDPDLLRREGIGQLFGRVAEAQEVEQLALQGGLGAVATGGIELLFAAPVLLLGAAGLPHLLLLGLAIVLVWSAGRFYLRRRTAWTRARLGMTHELIEQMVGHQTRLAQEVPERWHRGEDEAVARYLHLSQRLDRAAVLLQPGLPRLFLVAGLVALFPRFFAGDTTATALAVSLGGLLLASSGLARAGFGALQLAGAAVAWRQLAPLDEAANRREAPGALLATAIEASSRPSGSSDGVRPAEPDLAVPVVQASDLVYRYREGAPPVLSGVDLTISRGDRLLLAGPSGSGKSTLAALLSGVRRAETGLLLARGLDRHSLGLSGWRRRVAAAPQFHENHIFSETFAFNLLMGRRWPPRAEDLAEAEELCHALGLGELLRRMPGGMLQLVGDTGWQLSHGEKSRVYLARALLQGAELVLLDESLAALDPENLERALRATMARAETLLVIAHP
ncbi:MAG: ATP-binding cassette domain-containing protein [Deltaproteobacteria bacterium]|nr:ATP-binding cassette domain-containing protein [Deltaproteobacteria bacterium]